LLLVVGAVVLLVAAGIVVWLVTRPDERVGGGGGTGPTATQSSGVGQGTTPAERAYQALPRAGALPDSALIVPRDVGGNVDLFVVDADSGATGARLTTAPEQDGSPQISPDRQTVLFLRKQADDTRVLMTVATDGTGERPVFPTPLADCPDPRRPAWNQANPTQLVLRCSPDVGARVLLVTFDGAAQDLDLGVPRVGDVSLSPDGTQLAYWGSDDVTRDGGSIYVLPLDGSAAPTQITDVGPGIDADPIWSPDGSQLAFRREVGDGERRVMLMGTDGSDVRQLTDGPGLDQDPAWSPDGARIAFKSDRPPAVGPVGEHVWIVDGTGGDPTQLDDQGATAPNEPAWGAR
jgi:Tol biopolymer transport system component